MVNGNMINMKNFTKNTQKIINIYKNMTFIIKNI